MSSYVANEVVSGNIMMLMFVVVGVILGVISMWKQRGDKLEKEAEQLIREAESAHREAMRDLDRLARKAENEERALIQEIRSNERYLRELKLLKAKREQNK